jgi:S-methyl-5-thioribose-1-phosphate isomerase
LNGKSIMKVKGRDFRAVWMRGASVWMIDQKVLPHRFRTVRFKNHCGTARAIKDMTVRGAGSIGAAAGFAAAQVVLEAPEKGFKAYLQKGFRTITATRPTAQDLFYAVEKIAHAVRDRPVIKAKTIAVKTANAISDEYVAAGRAVGRFGNRLIRKNCRILTHCNAGWLALQDWGSALAPVYMAHRKRKKPFVYVDETRPRLQGAKLTAWELAQEGVGFSVIADNAAGVYLRNKMIDMVIVGADRIAANGDIANKVGTYEKAVLARENRVPFYVAAPSSTVDMQCPSGSRIPIEEREQEEVAWIEGMTVRGKIEKVRVVPKGTKALNPAFDVTPAKYITAFITDRGIVKPGRLASLF